jgi:heat shock protein HslJ
MNRPAAAAAGVPMVAVILLSGLVLSACGATGEKAAGPALRSLDAPAPAAGTAAVGLLADTRWRLVEIHSMDDAVGTARPEDPSRYTMHLHGDGRVALRLNCNSASGTWTAEAGPDPSSGRFAFSPLAMTRVFCPPPSLDQRVAAQAEFVRSYLLKDGRLHLSLLADGSIFVWEPHADEPFRTKPDKGLEAAILRAEPSYTRKVVDAAGGTGTARYVYGREEVFVYLLGSIFCGTGGCNLLLFTEARDGYVLVNRFPISRLPVIVSSDRTNVWTDLIRLESGGGAKASYVRHTFDGRRYVEGERMPAEKAPEGAKHLAGELTFDRGIPLEPRD